MKWKGLGGLERHRSSDVQSAPFYKTEDDRGWRVPPLTGLAAERGDTLRDREIPVLAL